MSEPLTPRLEQVRQAILQLLGDPDATMADLLSRLGDVVNEELNNGAYLNNIYAQMQDIVYPWVDADAPPVLEPWSLHNWRRGTAFLADWSDATANQPAGDLAAATHLPVLPDIEARLASILLTTAATRDAVAHNPGGGLPVLGAVDVLMEISAKLSAVITGQGAQAAALAAMNVTLEALLACCEGGASTPRIPPAFPLEHPCAERTGRASFILPITYQTFENPWAYVWTPFREDTGSYTDMAFVSSQQGKPGFMYYKNTTAATTVCFAFNLPEGEDAVWKYDSMPWTLFDGMPDTLEWNGTNTVTLNTMPGAMNQIEIPPAVTVNGTTTYTAFTLIREAQDNPQFPNQPPGVWCLFGPAPQ